MDNQYHILLVEDNESDARLIEIQLGKMKKDISVTTVSEKQSFLNQLQQNPLDLVLCDYNLPEFSGMEALDLVRAKYADLPFILVSGQIDEEEAVDIMQAGASDYVMKDNLQRLNPAVIRELLNYRQLKKKQELLNKAYQLAEIGHWEMDIKNEELFWSSTIKKMHEVDEDFEPDLENALTFVKDEHRKPLRKVLKRAIETGESFNEELIIKTAKGNERWVRIFGETVFENGECIRIYGSTQNIDKRRRAEEALRLSEHRFKSLIQDGSDLISILDSEGNYIYVSPNSERQTGLGASPEDFIGKSCFDFIHKEDQERIRNILKNLSAFETAEPDPYRLRVEDGPWRWLESIITNMTENPAIRGYIANTRDVTDRIKQQEVLRESVERFRILSKATSDTIWDFDLDKDVVRYNKNIHSMFGYSKQEVEKVGNWWRKKIHTDDYPQVMQKIEDALSQKKDRFQMEYRFQCADDSYKYIYDRAFIVSGADGQPVRIIGAMQDVTRQKKEEQWLKLMESAVATTTESVVILEASPSDLPGRKILYVNDAFTGMTGYNKEEAVGKTPHFLTGPETDDEVRSYLRSKMDNWKVCEAELINYKKNGEPFWINVSMSPVKNSDGDYSHWVCVGRDISERKSNERELKESLKEKEVLLMEIHHRVKNNLAVVSGIMQLQAFDEENKGLQKKLYDSVVRIQTMGTIHELLYQSKNLSKVFIDETIKKLVTNITQTFHIQKGLETTFELEEIELNINQAIPCSLIVNEVITNVLKHAFKDQEKGNLYVAVYEKDKKIHVEIQDDGKKLPPDFNSSMTGSTLGLKLIETLSKQLNADYNYDSLDSRTRFNLNFEKAEAKGIGNIHL